MGTWGTGIGSNDTYLDIYGEFIEFYDRGMSVSEITQKLISENPDLLQSPEDSINFWFAIAKAQWECKELENEILVRVEEIIKSGEDLIIWRDLGGTESDLKKRELALNKFLEKIKIEKNKPRKRKKKKLYDSIFSKGDCLVYKMENGNFGGAFVLAEEKSTMVGANEIAITKIDKTTKPSLEDFKNAEVYVRRFKETSFKNDQLRETFVDQPQIGGFSALSFKRDKIEIEVIGQLAIFKDYDLEKQGKSAYPWSVLTSMIPSKEKYIELNGTPKSKVKLSKWIKKPWSKNWL